MRAMFKLLPALVGMQLATLTLRAAVVYQLDNNTVNYPLNASENSETLDNWFGNFFTALPDANFINEVDFYVGKITANSVASVSLYQVTGAGGNPALGATRLFTQSFTPVSGNPSGPFVQQIGLSSPVAFKPGDTFLVSILIRNVLATDYPYVLDTSGSSAGGYWGRSGPNLFDIDNLSGVVPTDHALTAGGFIPGHHTFIRAVGVPEPASIALAGLGMVALLMVRRQKGVTHFAYFSPPPAPRALHEVRYAIMRD